MVHSGKVEFSKKVFLLNQSVEKFLNKEVINDKSGMWLGKMVSLCYWLAKSQCNQRDRFFIRT